jgi:tetratricopeptide (TPR) repeat protein
MAKHKKTSVQETKNSGRSQPSNSAVAKRVTFALVMVGLIVCAAIAGLYCVLTLTKTKKESRTMVPSIDSMEGALRRQTSPTRIPEEEFAKLKKEEMKLARQVMKDFPDKDESNELMGNLYSRHGNSAEAIKFWERSLQINPKRVDIYERIGKIALDTGEPEKAITLWRKALEMNPKMPGVHNSIAQALIELGRYDEAITELEEESRISPVSILTCFLFAQAYQQQNEYDKARQYYEATIKLNPNFPQAYYGLYRVCVMLKQLDKAREYEAIFKKLRAKERHTYMGRNQDTLADLASLKRGVAKTYLDAERLYRTKGDIQEAERLLLRASQLEPTNTRCRERLASLYYMTGRFQEALYQFEKISQIDPNNAFCYLNIGQVSIRLELVDKAETAYRKAIELSPKQSAGYRELARLYLRMNKKLPEARQLAQKAVTLEKVADNYYVFAWAAEVSGDSASALQAMERAMELEPANLKYRQVYERIKTRN